jgi:high-affinity K+ transport system ATPase subunit B
MSDEDGDFGGCSEDEKHRQSARREIAVLVVSVGLGVVLALAATALAPRQPMMIIGVQFVVALFLGLSAYTVLGGKADMLQVAGVTLHLLTAADIGAVIWYTPG